MAPERSGQQLGLRYFTPAENNRARRVHDAKMSLFQRNVQSDIMVHGHAPLMAYWG